MKDEGAIDWWEGFPTSIGQGNKLKEGSWRVPRKIGISCVLGGKKTWRCEKDISS